MAEKRSKYYGENYQEIQDNESHSHSKSSKSAKSEKSSSIWGSFFRCILHYEITKVTWTILLSEMGDRSQIVAIGLAANYDFWVVAIAGSIGHFVAIILAIIFGKMVSACTTKRCMNFVGGVMFLIFGVYTFLYGQ